jgi:hypothetical protein
MRRKEIQLPLPCTPVLINEVEVVRSDLFWLQTRVLGDVVVKVFKGRVRDVLADVVDLDVYK